MPGLGLGTYAVLLRKRAGTAPAAFITATLTPASSVLVAGNALENTVNWSDFLDPANYATTAAGATIASVQVNYIGDTASPTELLADGDTNAFSMTVTDTMGTSRTFTVIPRTVVHAAPTAFGTPADQFFSAGTGIQTYDVSSGFTGSALSYRIDSITGVSINPASGVMSFDTDVMAAQSSTSILVTATNSGGSAFVDLSVTIAAPVTAVTSPIVDQSFHLASGDVTFDLRSVFTNATSYAASGAGASIDGDGFTLRLDDGAPRAGVTITVTGSNAFNSAADVFTLTVLAPVVAVTSPIADQSFVQNSGDVTFDLNTVFANATTYGVTGAGASISGSTLTLDDGTPRAGVTITVTGSNAFNNTQDVFTLTVAAAATTPARMSAPSLAVDSATQITATLASDPGNGGSAITSRDLRHSTDQANWTTMAGVSSPLNISGLTAGTLYYVQTRAVNIIGAGAWSASASVTTSVPEVPSISGFTVGAQSGTDIPIGIDLSENAVTPYTVFIVAVPAGASAPSAAQVRAGQNAAGAAAPISANYSASIDGTTNIAANGASTGSYDFYATVIDNIGTAWGSTISATGIALNFAPVLSSPTAAANGAAGATALAVTTTEGDGTLFWGIYPTATTPTAAAVVAGTGATVAGSQAVSSAGAQPVANQTGLAASTGYRAHYVHRDTALNLSNVARSAEFTTAAAGLVNPNSLGSSLDHWFDFTDTSKLFQDAGRTVPVTTIGQDLLYTDGKKTGTSINLQASNSSGSATWAGAASGINTNADNFHRLTAAAPSGLDTNMEVYFALKFKNANEDDSLMGLESDSNIKIAHLANGRGATAGFSGISGAPICSVNGVDIAGTNTTAQLDNAVGTDGVVFGIRNLDLTALHHATRRIAFFARGDSTFRANIFCTHIVLTRALTTTQRTDLINWLSARVPA